MLLNHGRSTKIKEKWWNEHSLHKSSASGRHDAALLNHSQWIWSRAEDGTRDVPRGMKGSDSHAQTHVYEQGHTCSCQCGLYSRLKNIQIFEDTSNTHTHTHTHIERLVFLQCFSRQCQCAGRLSSPPLVCFVPCSLSNRFHHFHSLTSTISSTVSVCIVSTVLTLTHYLW